MPSIVVHRVLKAGLWVAADDSRGLCRSGARAVSPSSLRPAMRLLHLPVSCLLIVQAFTRGMYELMKGQLGVTAELPGAPKKEEVAGIDSEEESDKSEL